MSQKRSQRSNGSSPSVGQPNGLAELRAEIESDPVALAAYNDTIRHGAVLSALSRIRKFAGRKQKAVAERMGTTQSAISALESGKSDPQLRTLQRYARAVNKRFDFAFVDETLPVFDESMAAELWKQVETSLLSPLLTKIATGSIESRTPQALADGVKFSSKIVGPILQSLEERGWVTTLGYPGDPFYALGEKAAYIIGVSIESDRIVGALINMRTYVEGGVKTHSLKDTSESSVVRSIVDVAAQLYDEGQGRSILGVGVSIAGIVSGETGTVKFAPDLCDDRDGFLWNNVQLEALVQAQLQKRVGDKRLLVAVTNDANSVAMLEYLRDGPHSIAAVMMSGAGIGVGFVNKGHVVNGFNGAAGEGGHVIVDPDGEMCRANFVHQGCLETATSAKAILRKLALPTETIRDMKEGLASLNVLIQQGDEKAQQVLQAAGEMLGRFLATTMALLDPQRLVLFAHPQLANVDKYESARFFQEAVEAGVAIGAVVTGEHPQAILRPPAREWYDLTKEANASAAGAAAMRHFLASPAYWQPDVLAPVVSNVTDVPKITSTSPVGV